MFGNGKTAETRAGVTFRCGRVSVWLHVETNAFHETLEFVAVNGDSGTEVQLPVKIRAPRDQTTQECAEHEATG